MKFAVPWMFLLFLPLLVAAWRLLRVGRKSGIRFSAVARLPSRAAGIRAQIAALNRPSRSIIFLIEITGTIRTP